MKPAHITPEEMLWVKKMAYKLLRSLPACVRVEDLIQAGCLGLIEAHQRFDENKNTQLSTFANLRVRGAMFDELRRAGWASRTMQQQAKLLAQTEQQCTADQQRAATQKELAERLQISSEQLHHMLVQASGIHVHSFEEGSVWDVSADEVSHSVAHQESFLHLEEAIAGLKEKEAFVVRLHYQQGFAFMEIAERLGVSDARVSQIHHQALDKLRVHWASLEASEPEAISEKGPSLSH